MPPLSTAMPSVRGNLTNTEVVATLDTPIPKGKSAVWCASFLAAWKTLATEVAKEPIALEKAQTIVGALNQAADPRKRIPQQALYTAAGWQQQGIVQKIQNEVVQKFPNKPAPTFPGITRDSFVAYAYLEASIKFSLPYFDNRQPMNFTDSTGQKTPVASFGIRHEDDYAYAQLRQQPRVLFRKGNGRPGTEEGLFEFAIDLCADSQPNQIVVARINREPTLAAAIARVEKETKKTDWQDLGLTDGRVRKIGINDVLLLPNMLWFLSHHFSELEGKRFANHKLKGQRLDIAQQDIFFRLDRSGVELKSESKMLRKPIPTYFLFDRPFLLYMCPRGSKAPYFALWIDNPELLTQWTNGASSQ